MIPLSPTWTALGHRLAVIAGAGTALIALLRHLPVRIASLRGALAWLAVLLLFRAGRALLGRRPLPAAPEPAAEGVAGEGAESEVA